jgi:hypothetical protein
MRKRKDEENETNLFIGQNGMKKDEISDKQTERQIKFIGIQMISLKQTNNGTTRRCTRPPTALRSCLASGFRRRVSLSFCRGARLSCVR